jgi:hypothetical protein
MGLVGCSDDEALVQPQLTFSLGVEKLPQDEDDQQEQTALLPDNIWSSGDFHMSPKQGMQHTKGMKLVPALMSDDVCVANPTCSMLLQQRFVLSRPCLCTHEVPVCAGVKGEEVTQFASLSLFEKRSRMISHPTAVQINARLLAIRQVAKCC